MNLEEEMDEIGNEEVGRMGKKSKEVPKKLMNMVLGSTDPSQGFSRMAIYHHF
jgi:hypothetical protein